MAMRVHDGGGADAPGRQLFGAVVAGDETEVRALLAAGRAEVNYVDPQTGYTSLHVAAAQNATTIIKLLVATGRCDFSLKDQKGRTPAVIAFVLGESPAIGRYLLGKQYAAANPSASEDPRGRGAGKAGSKRA